jgi:hypothetical protein
MSSHKVMIRVRRDVSRWHSNGLRFAGGAQAHDYGMDLKERWPEVVAVRVDFCPADEPNCSLPMPNDRYVTVYHKQRRAASSATLK